MRRLLVAAGLVVLLAGATAAYWVSHHRFGGDVRGTSTEFVPTQTVAPPRPGPLVSPMFGVEPQRLHVGVGTVRPPYKLTWIAGGVSLIEFPPAVAFGYLYYANLAGHLLAVSARTGRRLWTLHLDRCEAAGPAVNRLNRGSVFETFLNHSPCERAKQRAGDGEVVAVAAGRPAAVRWRKHIGATETSPLIVGNHLYVGDDEGNVWCLAANTGRTIWKYHAGGPVKGAVTYDRGRVFFGAYDGSLYSLDSETGKLVWRSTSARDLFGGHGTFYSTPAVAYSRIYLGSTDGRVYSFGEQSGKLRWAHGTGGYVYGSPAVWRHRVFVGSYDGTFYAFDAATGNVLWHFHANGSISGSATVVDGIVYFATVHGRTTYGLDARTGKKLWSYPDGSFTPVVTDGEKLYVVGWGKLYAFTPRR